MRYTREQVRAIATRPFMDLVFEAASVHRAHHDPNQVQWSTLLSIKTGACPEDCSYCSQSARWNTALKKEPLLDLDTVIANARAARDGGSTRFCMGAAWRRVRDRDVPKLAEMVREVKALGLETCMTLGTVDASQAKALKEAGLDYYNHNLDTSREYYPEVITTRSYDERLQTLQNVREAGMKVCCGGIVGMGESEQDRYGLLAELANLEEPPESVPINQLVVIDGTPLNDQKVSPVSPIEFVRMIATARILMPKSVIRLSAGRQEMSDELQALCFLAGASSIFAGEKLLTTGNPAFDRDEALLSALGMRKQVSQPSAELDQHAAGHAPDQCGLPSGTVDGPCGRRNPSHPSPSA